jgi:hypothetical protein
MNQIDILEYLWAEKNRHGYTVEQFKQKTGVNLGIYQDTLNVLKKSPTIDPKRHTEKKSVMINGVIAALKGLGKELIIVDEGANLGIDPRVLTLPPLLYVHERIENRAIVRQEGFHARVDFYETEEICLKYATTPCDVYEIYPRDLIRSRFVLEETPYGTRYSYNDRVSPDHIDNRTTHR